MKGAAGDREVPDSATDKMVMNLSQQGDRGGQRRLTCCNPWIGKESDTT